VQPRKWSIWRFSLRTLLLLVTALCVLLAYEWEWIRERRAFMNEQIKVLDGPEQVNVLMRSQNEREREKVLRQWQNPSAARAPSLLWVFGEKGRGFLRVVLKDDVTKKDNIYYVSRSHPTLIRARRFFPEARIAPLFNPHRDEGRTFCSVQEE
jgi:hypothetical protein